MTKKDLFNFLLGQPDDMVIKFSSQGYTVELDHAMAVPEWNTIYLGENSEDLTESLQEEIERDAVDDGAPSEADLKDRDAFLEALENQENYKDWKGDPTDDCPFASGPSCSLTSVKPEPAPELATGVM